MTSKKLTDDVVRQIHNRFLQGELKQDLAVEYQVSPKTLWSSFHRLGLPTRSRRNPRCADLKYDLEAAHARYLAGEDAAVVAKACGIGPMALVTRFKQRGLETFPACRRAKHCTAAQEFNPVLTERAAYWLGFLAADGAAIVMKHKSRTSYCISVTLGRRDKDHLLGLVDIVGGKIYDYGGEAVILKGRATPDWQCLEQYGFGGKKSHRLAWPTTIDPELMRHFVRGFFDGDGSVSARRSESGSWLRAQWTVVSISGPFIQSMRDWLRWHNLRANCYVYPTRGGVINGRRFESKTTMHQVHIGAHDDLVRLHQLLYDGATVYLDRKKAVFQLPMQHRANARRNKRA